MTERRKGHRQPVVIKTRKQVCFRLDEESQEFLEKEALRLSSVPPFHDISMSDLLRFAVREYRERHEGRGLPAVERKGPCDVVDTIGGSYCTVCAARGRAGEMPACKRSSD